MKEIDIKYNSSDFKGNFINFYLGLNYVKVNGLNELVTTVWDATDTALTNKETEYINFIDKHGAAGGY